MTPKDELLELLERLKALAPAGFAAAFHVDFVAPRYLFQTYGDAWMAHYSEKGLVRKDPAVRWGYQNDGIAAWPEVSGLDTEGVFDAAAEHGMAHWSVMATSEGGSKSIGAFSRSDKAFDPAEEAALFETFKVLHHLTRQGLDIDPEFGAVLSALSVKLTHR